MRADEARPGRTRRGSVGPALRLFAVVFLAYVVGAALSWQAFGTATTAAFFPPAGVTVAALLLSRRTLWPVIIAAIVLAEMLIDLRNGSTVPFAAGLALANVAEPLVGAALVRAGCGGPPDLRRPRDLIIFVAGAAAAGPLVGGMVGSGTALWFDGAPWILGVLRWFAGDSISVLVVGSAILLWRKQSHILKSRPLETVTILAVSLVLAIIGFATEIPPGTTVLPTLALAALRLGMLGTALSGSLVAAAGTYLTGRHRGLIAEMSAPDPTQVALAQIFIGVSVLTAMIIAQEVTRRTSAVRERDVERSERAQVESLSALAQKLSAALNPDDIGQVLKEHLLGEVGASSYKLGLLSRDGDRLDWVAGSGGPPRPGPLLSEPGIATEAVRTGKPTTVGSVRDEQPSDGVSAGAQSAWPISQRGRTIGVLQLGWPGPQSFEAHQWAYLGAVAAIVGQPLARARSYADEHTRALVLHSALHPEGSLDTAGVECQVYYEPSDEIHGLGGDWYDVVSLPGNRTYLSVGDIAGHGIQALEDMAQLRNAGRAYALRHRSPGRLLTELNGFAEIVVHGEFATAVVAFYDHESGLLSYSSAGHPPPLLRRAATGEVVRLDDANGLVLGPIEDAEFTERAVRVDPGDILVMYTDGLVEQSGTSVRTGISRLEKLVADWPPEAPLDCKALADRLAPPPRSDDICVVVVRFRDSAPTGQPRD